MLRFDDFLTLRESDRIEYKSATGGFPNSFWETYSAFANTEGGVIVLGVKERDDGLPVPVELSKPQQAEKALWDGLNNRKKTSANILVDSNVSIDEIDGVAIMVVNVPRAEREDRPVFINNDLLWGSYRRNGEGDYHCTRSEVSSMVRDSYPGNQDKRVLDKYGVDALNMETVHSYRNFLYSFRLRHPWSQLDEKTFLLRIGALGRSEANGELCLTHAGLLMFGDAWRITDEYPDYFLDCRQVTDGRRWDNRIVYASGDCSGNVYDFYRKAYLLLVEDLPVPFQLDSSMMRVDDTWQHRAVREALVNALVHADYYGRAGIVAIRRGDRIEVANPGLLRTPSEVVKAGGGFDVLRQSTRSVGKPDPELRELYDPERTFLTLLLETRGLGYSTAGDGSAVGEDVTRDAQGIVGGKRNAWEERYPEQGSNGPCEPNADPNDSSATVGNRRKQSATDGNCRQTSHRERQMIRYISEVGEVQASDVASAVGLGPTQTRSLLRRLVAGGLLVRTGASRATRYALPDYDEPAQARNSE
jgi:predicted HTH transcriptional regulator